MFPTFATTLIYDDSQMFMITSACHAVFCSLQEGARRRSGMSLQLMVFSITQHARQMIWHQLFSTPKSSLPLLNNNGRHLNALLERLQLHLSEARALICQQGSQRICSSKPQLNSNTQTFPQHCCSLHVSAYLPKQNELPQNNQQAITNQHITTTVEQPTSENFIDYVRVTATGGRGGNGAVSYTRVARGRYLAAAGGDGAKGGNVILKASRHLTELHGIPRHVRGGDGGPGGRNGRTGARGKDMILHVPTGTIVYELLPRENALQDKQTDMMQEDEDSDETYQLNTLDSKNSVRVTQQQQTVSSEQLAASETAQFVTESDATQHMTQQDMEAESMHQVSEEEDDDESIVARPPRPRQVLAELLVDGQQLVVATGGLGGRGNASQQAPAHKPYPGPSTDCTPGQAGTTVDLLLELKLLADIGFVGMPNAGKSSLLSALTAAKAKVGSYAFTTLRPQLGTLVFDEGDELPQIIKGDGLDESAPLPRILTVADIPGLVEGAHVNRGRGNAFLRHVERVHCVAYVIDLSGGQEGALVALPPQQQLAVLQAELQKYRSRLADVPCVIAANKVDACHDPHQALAQLAATTPHPILPVSALHQAGLHRLKHALRSVSAQQALATRHQAMGCDAE